MVCVVSWWVSGCLSFPKTPPSGGGEVGSEAGRPGSRAAAGSRGRGPIAQPPKTALALREREGKDKERAAGWPHSAHPAGEEGRGFTGKRGRPGRQKGPWAPAFQRPGLPALCHRAAGRGKPASWSAGTHPLLPPWPSPPLTAGTGSPLGEAPGGSRNLYNTK